MSEGRAADPPSAFDVESQTGCHRGQWWWRKYLRMVQGQMGRFLADRTARS